MRVEFFVIGKPATAGSKNTRIVTTGPKGSRVPKLNAHGLPIIVAFDQSGERGKTWRADIREAAMEAMAGYPAMEGPLEVDLAFKMPRPQHHYRKSGLKPDAPYWHTNIPDIDKVSRAVLDALKGIVWVDDKQVVIKRVVKRYADGHVGEREGVVITVANATDVRLVDGADEALRLPV